MAQLLEDASRKHPYWKRDPRAFWRGHIRWRNKDCDHESGNIARFLGTLLTLRHPEHFDVKVRHLEAKKALWTNSTALRATKCKDSSQKYPFRGVDDGLLNRLSEAQDVSWVAPVDYARYKILAHFPGGTLTVTVAASTTLGHRLDNHDLGPSRARTLHAGSKEDDRVQRRRRRGRETDHGQPAFGKTPGEGAADAAGVGLRDCLHASCWRR